MRYHLNKGNKKVMEVYILRCLFHVKKSRTVKTAALRISLLMRRTEQLSFCSKCGTVD